MRISIHALREEGDPHYPLLCSLRHYFYPRPPRGGRPRRPVHQRPLPVISIHALREEGDTPSNAPLLSSQTFLSTPSARRATRCLAVHQRAKPYFYPRPPRGGRLFSIVLDLVSDRFLSTPSARRATKSSTPTRWALRHFYPRPPRGGRRDRTKRPITTPDFYPRPPRGGRHRSLHPSRSGQEFLSTPSARRATNLSGVFQNQHGISIHALREEGDSKNGEKHLRFCFIIKRSAQIWKSLSKNIRKNSCDLHRTA